MKKKKNRWKAYRNLGAVISPPETEPKPSTWDNIREWLRVLLFVVVVFIVFAIALAGIKSCTSDLNTNRQQALDNKKTAPFKVGDLVQAKVSGQLGYVVDVGCYPAHCLYDVRFNANASRTNVSLFGKDEFVNNYPMVLITGLRDFELKKVR